MNISIIIVNWNAGEQLYRCVNSAVQYSSGLDIEIIVVDNGSADNSIELISELPKTSVIEASQNLGFGKACNLGARKAQGELLLFLNPDAEVYDDTLSKTYDFMSKVDNHNVGVCGVQLVNDKNEVDHSCSRFPSFLNLLSQSLGLNKFFKSTGMRMLDWNHRTDKFVDQIMGAYFCIRKELFEQLNGFDERFFVYFEEVDLSLKLKEAGYQSYFNSTINAFHHGGGVSEKVKATRLFYSWRSRTQYCFKHFSFLSALGCLLTTVLVEPLTRSIYFVFKKDLLSVKETWQAWFKLVVWLPKFIKDGGAGK